MYRKLSRFEKKTTSHRQSFAEPLRNTELLIIKDITRRSFATCRKTTLYRKSKTIRRSSYSTKLKAYREKKKTSYPDQWSFYKWWTSYSYIPNTSNLMTISKQDLKRDRKYFQNFIRPKKCKKSDIMIDTVSCSSTRLMNEKYKQYILYVSATYFRYSQNSLKTSWDSSLLRV